MMAGKQKNRKFVTKRAKITGSGKVMIQKAAGNHLLQQKSKKQKAKRKSRLNISPTNIGRVRGAVPGLNKL
jgi:ribosomal protein L35